MVTTSISDRHNHFLELGRFFSPLMVVWVELVSIASNSFESNSVDISLPLVILNSLLSGLQGANAVQLKS